MGEESILEAVGQAEDVISRLISERRALENAQQVLRTYRMVKSEMEPTLEELRKVKSAVVEERRQLEAVEGQRVHALTRAREEVDRFRSEQMEQVKRELDDKREELVLLSKEYDTLMVKMEEADGVYTSDVEKRFEELARLDAELASVKKEHAILAEAISRVTGFFTKESV